MMAESATWCAMDHLQSHRFGSCSSNLQKLQELNWEESPHWITSIRPSAVGAKRGGLRPLPMHLWWKIRSLVSAWSNQTAALTLEEATAQLFSAYQEFYKPIETSSDLFKRYITLFLLAASSNSWNLEVSLIYLLGARWHHPRHQAFQKPMLFGRLQERGLKGICLGHKWADQKPQSKAKDESSQARTLSIQSIHVDHHYIPWFESPFSPVKCPEKWDPSPIFNCSLNNPSEEHGRRATCHHFWNHFGQTSVRLHWTRARAIGGFNHQNNGNVEMRLANWYYTDIIYWYNQHWPKNWVGYWHRGQAFIPCYSPHFWRLLGLQAGYPAPESVGAWKTHVQQGQVIMHSGCLATAATKGTTTQEFPSFVDGITGAVTKELHCNLLKVNNVEQC